MENKRILWMDVAKGIGMFLVVLGHTFMVEERLFIHSICHCFSSVEDFFQKFRVTKSK